MMSEAVATPAPSLVRPRGSFNLQRVFSQVIILLIVVVQVYPLVWILLASMVTMYAVPGVRNLRERSKRAALDRAL